MGEMTLEDLADTSSSASSSSGGSSGEWVTDLIDKLDEKGVLEPLIFGDTRSMDEIRDDGEQQTEQTEQTEQADQAPDLDAERLKDVMLQVYDNTGMIPGVDDDPRLSDLIKLVDSNPEMVDKLIEQHL